MSGPDPDPTWPLAEEGDRPPGVGPKWPPRDRLGRTMPRRFNALTLFRAVPSVIGAFATVVPDEFWSKDQEGDDSEVAIVACPCGEEPHVPLAQTVECGCGRFFLGMGDQVRVFNPNAQDNSRPTS